MKKTTNLPTSEPRIGPRRLLGGFQKFARIVVVASGHPMAFACALGVIGVWLLLGPIFRFSNTWLLVIDTIGNLLTFLMIFLIRNAQTRESEAVQLKLDELIRATKDARNTLLDIEELSEEELDKMKHRFERLAHTARAESAAGHTGHPFRAGPPDTPAPAPPVPVASGSAP